MKTRLLSLLLLLTAALLPAQDVLFMNNGEKRAGKLIGVDAKIYRLQIPLPVPAGAQSAGFATATVPRTEVARIEFADDPARDEKLATATPARLAEVEPLWKQAEPWLGIPKSPAGKIAAAYGALLLKSGQPENAARALALFQRIETESWSEADHALARQGRLQALIATGRAAEAAAEAAKLARETEDPAIVLQAKFILAEAADQSLRTLVAENPRWEEDVHVIPERARLMNAALDDYLYASLFFGSEIEPAARGLWGATSVYQFTGQTELAVETCRDLLALYPATSSARLAQDFLNTLTDEQKQTDYEKEAKDETP
ncbi:MAG TPA: hypothetical protein VIS74_05990 [Chthoniobacterales bacterium]